MTGQWIPFVHSWRNIAIALIGPLTGLVGKAPMGIAFDGVNIWVAAHTANTVTKLRASDGTPLDSFRVGMLPLGVAFRGANIWAASSGQLRKL